MLALLPDCNIAFGNVLPLYQIIQPAQTDMRKHLLLSITATIISLSAFSQITYLADTAFTTDVGYGGAPASCIYTGGENYGWQMGLTEGTLLADFFYCSNRQYLDF
jgi:hypothetical protein